FREEAHRRKLAEQKKQRLAAETSRRLVSMVDEILKRVDAEKEWLERHHIRVFFDNNWQPNYGIRICRLFDGSSPQSPFDDQMRCCSIWTGGDVLGYGSIDFARGDAAYYDDGVFEEGATEEVVWKYFVERVCDCFDLNDDPPLEV